MKEELNNESKVKNNQGCSLRIKLMLGVVGLVCMIELLSIGFRTVSNHVEENYGLKIQSTDDLYKMYEIMNYRTDTFEGFVDEYIQQYKKEHNIEVCYVLLENCINKNSAVRQIVMVDVVNDFLNELEETKGYVSNWESVNVEYRDRYKRRYEIVSAKIFFLNNKHEHYEELRKTGLKRIEKHLLVARRIEKQAWEDGREERIEKEVIALREEIKALKEGGSKQ
nr:hypothetical protein [Moritella viscosa]SHO14714.1 Elongation factor 4-Ribosomal back-translocase LepA [Moritella viscosa]